MKKMCFYVTACTLTCSLAMAAVEFTASITTGPRDKSVTRGLVDGLNARIEFVEGKSTGMEKGSYMITRDGGKTITMVNPKDKTYMKIDPEQMASAAGQLMNATKGFMSMTFKNPTVETLEDEKGPAMLGLPTRRVKTKTAYTLETSVFGSKNISQVTREDEMWVTTKMSDPGFNLWLKQRNIKTGNEDIDKLIELETGKVKGFPLKTVSKTTTRDAKGREEIATTAYEITSLKETSAPKVAFDIPADYTDSMAELGEELRKAKKGAEDDAGEHSENAGQATDAVNTLMKGLFGGGKR